MYVVFPDRETKYNRKRASVPCIRPDCHIYDRHIPAVKAMIEKEGFAAPKVTLDPSVTNFYDFTKDSFKVEDYKFHPFNFEIEMAI